MFHYSDPIFPIAASILMATPTTPSDPELPSVTFGQLLTLLMIGLCGLFVVAGLVIGGVFVAVNSGGSDRPSIVSPDAAAEQSIREYAASLADLYAMAAEGIERGDIGSDVELLEYTEATADARQRAFESFDDTAEDSIANGEWTGRDIDEAREWCELAAEGFRRCAE